MPEDKANDALRFPDALNDWLGERRIEEVECVIADTSGVSRGKAMPYAKFTQTERMFLPQSIFFQTIAGDWVDIEIENQWTEADMVLVPDMSTAVASPWAQDITIQVIHDAFDHSGEPIELAPRNVLKRVLTVFAKEGWQPVVAPEMEFYLTKPNTDPNQPIEPPIGRTGRRVAARQAYSVSAVDEYGAVIDDIYDFAEAMGYGIDTIIQEGGAGQIEINLVHGHPLALADQVFYFKRMIREAALRHDCFATFMAKPMQDEPGSAMHIHQSLLDADSGRNLFSNDDGSESDLFRHFLGGQQAYLPQALCLMAPYVNSYRRYTTTAAAPINLEWGSDNRTTGLRIPVSGPEGRRIENRIGGMDCNP